MHAGSGWRGDPSRFGRIAALLWRMAGDDNSGVFVGFPPAADPGMAVARGYEVRIDATDAAGWTTPRPDG